MIIIHTEWNEYRGIDLIKVNKLVKSKVILDFRNIFNRKKLSDMDFIYNSIGQK